MSLICAIVSQGWSLYRSSARNAHTSLTCAERACKFITVSDEDVPDDENNSVSAVPDGDAADDLVMRRRDVRGARRRQQILQLLELGGTGSLSVEEIAERFGVSFATVRRDLSRLHQDGNITRTYGGVSLASPTELSISQRHQEFTHEKDAIGRRAADLVDDGAVVILDAGTTTEFVARHLDATGVTVFTNSIGVINILLRNEEVSVVVLGGRLRPMNETISGAEAENMLRSVVADYAFIGADAVHPQYGIASRTLEQSRLKTMMTQHARQIVVVADSRKLHTDKFNYWAPFPARWLLITDDAANPAALAQLRGAGAQIDLTQPMRALTEPQL